LNASGLIINWSSELGLSDYVPYTGASSNLVLGDNNFSVGASDLFVDNVGGNVGIGTATPDSLLEMEGENAYLHLDGSNAGTIIDRGSTGDLAYTFFQTAGVDKWRVGLSNEHEADLVFNEGPSNDNVRLMIEAGGNVGIGITDPQNELHVVGDGNFSGYVMSQGINLTALNASGLIINWSNQIDLSGYVPYTGATSNLVLGDNNFSVGTSDLFVDNVGGRVGIGTTTPTSLFTTNTLAGTNEINLSGLFYLNSTSGRVGIGTSNPVVRLNIQSPADANQMILGSATGVTQGITAFDGSEFGMYFGVANTGKSWIQGGRTNTATAYDISLQASGGDVGIGTINPDEKLHVQEDTNGEAYILKLENSQFGVGDAVGQHFGLGSAAKSGILFERTSSYGRGNLHFLQNILADTSNANLTNSVMTITGDGKVGVGTTEPQNEFEVIGDGNFTGNVTVGDCIVFANGGKICSA